MSAVSVRKQGRTFNKTETERQRDTHKNTHRQRETQTHLQRDTHRKTHRQRDTMKHRQRYGQIHRKTDKEKYRKKTYINFDIKDDTF